MQFIKTYSQKLFLKLFTLLFALVLPFSYVYADTKFCGEGQICNPLGSRGIDNIQTFIKTLLEGLLKVGIPIVALAIIYCGFLFVKARGKSEELTKAKNALLYTLIGAAILLGSWAIAQLISNTVLSL